MSVFGQIVADFAGQPKVKVSKAAEPLTTKRCKGGGEVKPRGAFYERKTHSQNSLTALCKPCYIQQQNKRYAEYKI